MAKLNKLKQAQKLYVQENKTLDEIGMELDLSRRTLFYWKRNTTGTNESLNTNTKKTRSAKNLLELARKKMMRKLNSDLDKNSHTNQSEIYSFMNILKKHSVAQRIRSIYFPNQTKTTKLSHPRTSPQNRTRSFGDGIKALHSLVFT